MDQRADDIRQDIDTTRASLDAKLDALETKARQTFDLKHHVSERPWMALGAAVAVGYVLGSMGSNEPNQRWHGQPMTTTDYTQHAPIHMSQQSSSNGFLAPFEAEIDMLRRTAVTTVTNFVQDAIKEYVPALGEQLKSAIQDGLTSTPNSSRSSGKPTDRFATRQSDEATLNDLLTNRASTATREPTIT